MGRFRRATREKLKLRLAIDGPAKSGKTLTALRFAAALAALVDGSFAVIDTENRSASKYKGDTIDGVPLDFDVCELATFAPTDYTSLIHEAERGYAALVIDSLSHAWIGEGGALDLKDKQSQQDHFNSFTAWAKITPMQRQMIDAIIRCQCHVIVTMRTKTEYVLEKNARGKDTPRRVGMAPVQRDGVEYEFDIYASMDDAHVLTVQGSRCRAIDNAVVSCPGPDFLRPVIDWLETGAAPLSKQAIRESFAKRLGESATRASVDALGDEIKTAVTNGMIDDPALLRQAMRAALDRTAKATPATLEAIDNCRRDELGMTPEQLLTRLGQYGAKALADLTEDSAKLLLGELRAEVAAKTPPDNAPPSSQQAREAILDSLAACTTPDAVAELRDDPGLKDWLALLNPADRAIVDKAFDDRTAAVTATNGKAKAVAK